MAATPDNSAETLDAIKAIELKAEALYAAHQGGEITEDQYQTELAKLATERARLRKSLPKPAGFVFVLALKAFCDTWLEAHQQ